MWVFWCSFPGALLASLAAFRLSRTSHVLGPRAAVVSATFGLYALSYVLLIFGFWKSPAAWSESLRYVGLVQAYAVALLLSAGVRRSAENRELEEALELLERHLFADWNVDE